MCAWSPPQSYRMRIRQCQGLCIFGKSPQQFLGLLEFENPLSQGNIHSLIHSRSLCWVYSLWEWEWGSRVGEQRPEPTLLLLHMWAGLAFALGPGYLGLEAQR